MTRLPAGAASTSPWPNGSPDAADQVAAEIAAVEARLAGNGPGAAAPERHRAAAAGDGRGHRRHRGQRDRRAARRRRPRPLGHRPPSGASRTSARVAAMGRRLAAAALLVASGGCRRARRVSTASQATTVDARQDDDADRPTATATAASTDDAVAVDDRRCRLDARPPSADDASRTSTTALPAVDRRAFPPTVARPPFDAFTLLRDFYGQLGRRPVRRRRAASSRRRVGSTAEAFLFHEVGVAIAIFGHTSAPLPAYTVTADGPAVAVCRDDGVCESFSDFVVDGGAARHVHHRRPADGPSGPAATSARRRSRR